MHVPVRGFHHALLLMIVALCLDWAAGAHMSIDIPRYAAMPLKIKAIMPATIPHMPVPLPPNMAAVLYTIAKMPATRKIPLKINHGHAVIVISPSCGCAITEVDNLRFSNSNKSFLADLFRICVYSLCIAQKKIFAMPVFYKEQISS